MDTAALMSGTTYAGLGLFLIVCFCCYKLMQRKKYIILLVWPIIIYFCGPVFTSLFADAPVLGRYVFPELIFSETLIIFLYFITLLVADKFLDISAVIKSSLSNPAMRRLSHSPAFLPIYICTALAAMFLQIKLLHDFGSVLTGHYVQEGMADGLIPFWGFLAGLYELIFLLVVLFILSGDHTSKQRIFVIGIYCLTAALRVAGGTRLILIKELAFVLIIFYLRATISKRQLIFTSVIVLVAGSAVGLLRMQGAGDAALLGPVFGLVMESALDALTLNVAYQVQDAGFISQHSDVLHTIMFLFLSSIPKFARFSFTPADLDALSPYSAALQYGYDTYSPVGGMSGFATLCYVCSYPAVASVLLALTLGLLFRYAPAGNFKRIIILAFLLNAIHFWRDPMDIAVKQVVMDAICALTLFWAGNIRTVKRALFDKQPSELERGPARLSEPPAA
jgi:hypothetical protein